MFETIDLVSLGKRIKKLRGKESRSSFAESFFVAPSSLARWEAGESQPDISFLIRLVGFYNITLEWLMTGKDGLLEDEAKGKRVPGEAQFRYLDDEQRKTKNEKLPSQDNCVSFAAYREIECELRDLYKENARLLRENSDLKVENERLSHQVAQASDKS
ncbi:helix-turn-helix domain-containing protein [Pseudodesulfovibrio pelocollis]|uniref:helix-turn-helix domain-containing protein n=1 Tax=Pseudodesulfovibrio pelocollis TaxID=3051432 RepID=UPI00255B34D0|nr:helix-turn-helix domain-containing protein [Pseudodesulfovibrio sp. SB368]